MHNSKKVTIDNIDKIVFLDIDGCITSMQDEIYFNPDPKKYHPSKKIVDRLISFCKKTNSKVVISSNWRKFDIDGSWKNPYGIFKNPLIETINLLGDIYIGTLPKDRHILKSEALILWFEETGYLGNFVIFDDDLRENYQNTYDYNIKAHFIKIDPVVGITDNDIKNAAEILKD